MLIPPLEYKDVKSVLTGIQLLKILDTNDLNQMQEDIITELGINGKAYARWESKRNKFKNSIEELIESYEYKESTVPIEKFDDLKIKYNESIEEISKMEEDIEKMNQLISKLKEVKDKEAVDEIIEENSDEIEKFNKLTSKSKKQLNSLPSIVQEAIYQEYRNENLSYASFGEDFKAQQIRDAIEEDYLKDTGEGLTIIGEDPNISDAIQSLDSLKNFIDMKLTHSNEFLDYYKDNFDHRFEFTSRRFWNQHLF
jgi:hypothetical protein